MATGTTGQQTVDVVTPAAGESVSEGTILEWQVKVGDFIKLDETIVEISTDKVDLELPSPASGTVTEILVQEGDTVTVGQVIARIAVGADGAGATQGAPGDASTSGVQTPVPDGNGSRSVNDGDGSGNGAGAGDPAATASDDGATQARLVDVVTPAAGESVSEGTILEWRAKVGERDQGERHDRRDLDRQGRRRAAGSGQRHGRELLVQEGETVTVGQVIARIEARRARRRRGAATRQPRRRRRGSRANGAGGSPDGVKASPVAARVAASEGVDLAGVAGQRPGGSDRQVRRAVGAPRRTAASAKARADSRRAAPPTS